MTAMFACAVYIGGGVLIGSWGGHFVKKLSLKKRRFEACTRVPWRAGLPVPIPMRCFGDLPGIFFPLPLLEQASNPHRLELRAVVHW
jgi:hypothetical protein